MTSAAVVSVDGLEIFDNDFDVAINEACQKFGIDDLTKVSQRRWKRVLKFVGQRIFNDSKVLRDKNIIKLEGNNIPTNNNRFDYDIINILCDYYMDLSDQYDKLISAEAFSLFLNISRDTVGNWKDEDPSSTRFLIYKKLKDYRFECIKDNSFDNGNVTGTMYVGNVEYGTNMPGVYRDTQPRRMLDDTNLPRFGKGEDGEQLNISQNEIKKLLPYLSQVQ